MHRIKDAFLILFFILILALSALAFAYPWLNQRAPESVALARYAPLRDGDSTLSVDYDANGNAVAWRSSNVAVLLHARAFAAILRKPARDAIHKFYLRPTETSISEAELVARLAQTQIVEIRVREVNANERASDQTYILLREPRGEFLVSIYYAETNNDLVYDPPVLLLPATIDADSAWKTEGRGGSNDFVWSARVLQSGRFQNWRDCLQIETPYSLSRSELCTTRSRRVASPISKRAVSRA